MGLTKADLLEVFDTLPSNLNTAIKDYCTDEGIEFSEIKTKLQERS